MQEMSGESLDLRQESIDKLRELFPEVITESNQIDFDKLKAILSDDLDEADEKYAFTWNGKKNAIRIANTPTTATLKPVKEKSKNWNETENLYIEGDNLEVLKLLQKSYTNKVDVIYIDPPYNTGKDFVYNDSFSDTISNYREQTGQLDQDGYQLSTNTESDGRFHSKWLNMMYPRLRLARNLMSDDGVIFISINDVEHANLIKICNEIFGENNLLANLVWENKEGGGSSDSKYFRIKHEYIVAYSKNIINVNVKGVEISNLERYSSKDHHFESRGPYYLQKLGMGSIQYSESLDYEIIAPDDSALLPSDNNNNRKACWRWSKEKYEWGLENDYIVFKKDKNKQWVVYTKQYLKVDNSLNRIDRSQRPMGIINEFSTTQAAKHLQKLGLGNLFDYTKPVDLIEYIINRVSKEDSIILDFFSGSSTTVEAVYNLNVANNIKMKYVMVQLPEKVNIPEYKNITDIAIKRINRAGEKIIKENPHLKNTLDIGYKYFALDESNIKEWNLNQDNFHEEIDFFTDNFREGSTHDDIVYEIILKQGLDLNVKIDKKEFDDTTLYIITHGGMFVVVGEVVTEEIVEYIRDYDSIFDKASVVVAFQDTAFRNDSAKLNSFETLKAAGFKSGNIFTI